MEVENNILISFLVNNFFGKIDKISAQDREQCIIRDHHRIPKD